MSPPDQGDPAPSEATIAFTGALGDVGWSPSELARRLKINERNVRRCASGHLEPPRAVGGWLLRVAAAIDAAGKPDGWV